MTTRRLKGPVPSAHAGDNQARARDEFIGAAPNKGSYTWQQPHVREDVRLQLNVTVPEPMMLKLDWVSYQLGITKREFTETALRAALQAELKRLGVPPE